MLIRDGGAGPFLWAPDCANKCLPLRLRLSAQQFSSLASKALLRAVKCQNRNVGFGSRHIKASLRAAPLRTVLYTVHGIRKFKLLQDTPAVFQSCVLCSSVPTVSSQAKSLAIAYQSNLGLCCLKHILVQFCVHFSNVIWSL